MTGPVRLNADWAGGAAAAVCAIHCGVFPALAAFLGMARGGHWFAEGCVLISVVAGAVALGQGWTRHRDPKPGCLWICGTVFAVGGHGLEAGAAPAVCLALSICGAVLQMTAHWHNHRSSCGFWEKTG